MPDEGFAGAGVGVEVALEVAAGAVVVVGVQLVTLLVEGVGDEIDDAVVWAQGVSEYLHFAGGVALDHVFADDVGFFADHQFAIADSLVEFATAFGAFAYDFDQLEGIWISLFEAVMCCCTFSSFGFITAAVFPISFRCEHSE